jgi:gluconokinase
MGEPSGVRQVVVMGVSGVGKTTVATGISTTLGWTFAEGDAFHPEANVAKMASGQPLTDDDRWPWLRSIGDWMSEEIAAGRSSVVTCSALRRAYRDLLRERRPEVVFCHLVAGEDLIGERMVRRTDHYMPASLLPSQLAALEPLEPDEPGAVVSVEGGADEVIARAIAALDLTS